MQISDKKSFSTKINAIRQERMDRSLAQEEGNNTGWFSLSGFSMFAALALLATLVYLGVSDNKSSAKKISRSIQTYKSLASAVDNEKNHLVIASAIEDIPGEGKVIEAIAKVGGVGIWSTTEYYEITIEEFAENQISQAKVIKKLSEDIIRRRGLLILALQNDALDDAQYFAQLLTGDDINQSVRAESLFVLAKIYAARSDYKMSFYYINEAIKSDSSNPEYLITGGDIALLNGSYLVAKKYYSAAAIKLDNPARSNQISLAVAFEGLGIVYNLIGQDDLAIKHLNRSIAILENYGDQVIMLYADCIYNLGKIHFSSGHTEKSSKLFSKAASIAKRKFGHDERKVAKYNAALMLIDSDKQ